MLFNANKNYFLLQSINLNQSLSKFYLNDLRSDHSLPKVILPKYSKHWLYFLAAIIDSGCSKILNYGLNQGSFLSFLVESIFKIELKTQY